MLGPLHTEIEAYALLAAQSRTRKQIDTCAWQHPQPQASTRSFPSLRLAVGTRVIRFGAWVAGDALAAHRQRPAWGFLS